MNATGQASFISDPLATTDDSAVSANAPAGAYAPWLIVNLGTAPGEWSSDDFASHIGPIPAGPCAVQIAATGGIHGTSPSVRRVPGGDNLSNVRVILF